MSLKDIFSQKVKSLIVSVRLLTSYQCVIEGILKKSKDFLDMLVSIQKSENQKLFKKSQQVDCVSVGNKNYVP